MFLSAPIFNEYHHTSANLASFPFRKSREMTFFIIREKMKKQIVNKGNPPTLVCLKLYSFERSRFWNLRERLWILCGESTEQEGKKTKRSQFAATSCFARGDHHTIWAVLKVWTIIKFLALLKFFTLILLK